MGRSNSNYADEFPFHGRAPFLACVVSEQSTMESVNRPRVCPNRRDPCSNEDRLRIRGCCVSA
jgi:hypothetical protein